jgi:hypothetical protein
MAFLFAHSSRLAALTARAEACSGGRRPWASAHVERIPFVLHAWFSSPLMAVHIIMRQRLAASLGWSPLLLNHEPVDLELNEPLWAVATATAHAETKASLSAQSSSSSSLSSASSSSTLLSRLLLALPALSARMHVQCARLVRQHTESATIRCAALIPRVEWSPLQESAACDAGQLDKVYWASAGSERQV